MSACMLMRDILCRAVSSSVLNLTFTVQPQATTKHKPAAVLSILKGLGPLVAIGHITKD